MITTGTLFSLTILFAAIAPMLITNIVTLFTTELFTLGVAILLGLLFFPGLVWCIKQPHACPGLLERWEWSYLLRTGQPATARIIGRTDLADQVLIRYEFKPERGRPMQREVRVRRDWCTDIDKDKLVVFYNPQFPLQHVVYEICGYEIS